MKSTQISTLSSVGFSSRSVIICTHETANTKKQHMNTYTQKTERYKSECTDIETERHRETHGETRRETRRAVTAQLNHTRTTTRNQEMHANKHTHTHTHTHTRTHVNKGTCSAMSSCATCWLTACARNLVVAMHTSCNNANKLIHMRILSD